MDLRGKTMQRNGSCADVWFVVALLALAGCGGAAPLDTSPSNLDDGGLAASAGEGADGGEDIAPSAGTTCAALTVPTSVTPPGSTPVPASCACTRRPGLGNSYLCPMGANQSVTATLGPTGGSIELVGQQGQSSGVPFQIDFPPGAFTQTVTLRLTETSVPPPPEYEDWSPVYLVEPRGLALDKVAAVSVPFGSNGSFATTGFIAIPAGLGLYERDEFQSCSFTRLTDSYTNAGFEQASLFYLGYLFVGVPKTADQAACP
ncbi:MAG: hypothetical protein ACLQIJ_08590 [Polyangia bacterium]